MRIELQRPSPERVASYLEMIAEMEQLGETIWPGMLPRSSESLPSFVDRLLRAEHDPEPELVPASAYWAVLDGGVVGRIALRHHLNPALEEFGGHIGYEVRPSFRRRGIGSEMLRLLLATPRARALGKVLVTCAPDNLGSIRIIVANGGVLARTTFVERVQRSTSYYWIDLGEPGRR